MSKAPHIDLFGCTGCESCLSLCPGVFRRNRETGLIEVLESPDYPSVEIDSAITMCPSKCIQWEKP
ncbi:MAG: ferredoxin [Thermodesulfobacteriota bacterium]